MDAIPSLPSRAKENSGSQGAQIVRMAPLASRSAPDAFLYWSLEGPPPTVHCSCVT